MVKHKRRRRRPHQGPLKVSLYDMLREKPTFSICCVCEKSLGSIRLGNPLSKPDGAPALYSHGYCSDCKDQMSKGVQNKNN